MTNKIIISYKINSFAVELGNEFIVCIFNWESAKESRVQKKRRRRGVASS